MINSKKILPIALLYSFSLLPLSPLDKAKAEWENFSWDNYSKEKRTKLAERYFDSRDRREEIIDKVFSDLEKSSKDPIPKEAQDELRNIMLNNGKEEAVAVIAERYSIPELYVILGWEMSPMGRKKLDVDVEASKLAFEKMMSSIAALVENGSAPVANSEASADSDSAPETDKPEENQSRSWKFW